MEPEGAWLACWAGLPAGAGAVTEPSMAGVAHEQRWEAGGQEDRQTAHSWQQGGRENQHGRDSILETELRQGRKSKCLEDERWICMEREDVPDDGDHGNIDENRSRRGQWTVGGSFAEFEKEEVPCDVTGVPRREHLSFQRKPVTAG